jgi:hypothetical protein
MSHFLDQAGPAVLTAGDRTVIDKINPPPPFSRVVCWDPARVARVMDTEALQTAPEVFLATHSPMPLLRSDLRGEGTQDAASRSYTERKFLHDFLHESEDFAFVAVIGGAGTGKSHLVRWMAHQMGNSPSRRVLLIPRAGTSLHEVLRRLLEGIDGERFDEYRRRLNMADNAMTVPVARERLLDNLALTLRQESEKLACEAQSDDAELEAYLAGELPHLLSDPAFRGHFLQEGGVLDRLARQVIGEGTVERVEERRGFSMSDLPLRFQNVNLASEFAKQIYRALVGNDQLVGRAVSCLNRYLDDAVTQLAQMGGTDLLRLMRDVRIELAVHGVELVVLIEDLATLQGLDQQLLEALIMRPHQEGMAPLCSLRSAVAMNRGYFDGLRSTVRQRFDFRVVMGDGDTRDNATTDDIVSFTGRYLNAVRLRPDSLRQWYASQATDESHDGSLAPSACGGCPFMQPCHAAFGAIQGYGLYPFNREAVREIEARISPSGFNPRIQLKDGYKPILENYPQEIREGQFPSKALQEKLGGSRLKGRIVGELRRSDSKDYLRREVLLDLWGGRPDTVANLHAGIHKAFDLPLLGAVPVQTSEPEPDADIDKNKDATTVTLSTAERVLQAQLEELERWRAGGVMSQELMQALRSVVFPAVVASIDWNALHLIPGEFAGANAPFRPARSINFVRQILPVQSAAIQLLLPLTEEEITDTALALQALLQLRHHQSWQFADGHFYYRAFLRQVEFWSRHVIDQIDRLPDGSRWDPVPVATELLAVGSRLHGLPPIRTPELTDVVAALFQDLPDADDTERSSEWTALTSRFRARRKAITEALLARVACSKGNSREIQVIDAARLLPMSATIRRGEYPEPEVPAGFKKANANSWERAIDDCGSDLRARLTGAAVAERGHQANRYQAVLSALGLPAEADADQVTDRRRETIAAVQALLNAAASAGGVSGRGRKEQIEELSAAFEKVHLGRWAEAMRRVYSADDEWALLTELSTVPMRTGATAMQFVSAAEGLLNDVDRFVNAGTDGIGDAHVERMREVQTAIESGISDLDTMLVELAGGEG